MESKKIQWLNPSKHMDSSRFPRHRACGDGWRAQDDSVEADLIPTAAMCAPGQSSGLRGQS